MFRNYENSRKTNTEAGIHVEHYTVEIFHSNDDKKKMVWKKSCNGHLYKRH
jgi:hypothetical protein